MRYIAFGWTIVISLLLFAGCIFLFSVECPTLGTICGILFIIGIFSAVEICKDE